MSERARTQDDALVRAAMRGELDAVRALWQGHRRWVAAVLLAHAPRGQDIEDLLQDVAMTFVRTISTLRDPGAFKPWLRTVAINAARAAGRSVSVQRRAIADVEPAVGDGAAEEEHLERRERAERLMRLAMELPAGYREPLLLRTVQEMSYRQIAEITSLPETTIETRIARGRRMLRELAARAETYARETSTATTDGSGEVRS